jgi:hypothetical protein
MIFSLVCFTVCGGDDSSGYSPAKTYAIGDIGPSEVGIVLYIKDSRMHRLEAAPENWSFYEAGDPQLAWITGGNTQTKANYNTLIVYFNNILPMRLSFSQIYY